MTNGFRVFKYSVLIAVVLSLSCVTRLQPPKGPSSLNDTNSIVFGKIDLMIDDKPIDPKLFSFPKPVIQCFISPYISKTDLNKKPFSVGKYFFKLPIKKGGYFSLVIPPGKYCFVYFQYFWLLDSYPTFGVKTYTPKEPFSMVFNVPTNRVVYVGTILNDFKIDQDGPFSPFRGEITFSTTNNFREAKDWFLKSNPELQTNVVEREIEIDKL